MSEPDPVTEDPGTAAPDHDPPALLPAADLTTPWAEDAPSPGEVRFGALEAERWAGVVLHAGPDAALGLRLTFRRPDGVVADGQSFYWLVEEVGPHAPDGGFARVRFDLSRPFGLGTDTPVPDGPAPPDMRLTLEWARVGDGAVIRALTRARGSLSIIGDCPWDARGTWEPVPGGGSPVWRGACGDLLVRAAFRSRPWSPGGGGDAPPAPGDGPEGEGQPDGAGPLDGESPGGEPPGGERGPTYRLAVRPEGVTLVVGLAWGRGDRSVADLESRAHDLAETAEDRLREASELHEETRPRVVGPWTGLVRSLTDNIHWTVLVQPESGRLYTPAGRRWIFPRLESPKAPGGSSAPGGVDPAAGRTRSGSPPAPAPDDWTVFGWDSFFNALELGVDDPDVAWSTLLAGLESQYPNGNVPNWRGRYGGTPDRSQPPVGSYAALSLYLRSGDRASLAVAYPRLVRWSDWWVAERNGRPRRQGIGPGLLAWGSDAELISERVPPWEEGASGHQRAAWESGQDDLPLWDEARWDPETNVLSMAAVDLNAYRALDLECLARIAEVLGDLQGAARVQTDRDVLVRTMNQHLWCDRTGCYRDRLAEGLSPRLAASNFLPLVAGVPDPARAQRMVAVLTDPHRFWGRHVIPTISRDDPAFPDQQYWRGSIWPPMNYLLVQGLRRYGYRREAARLAWDSARLFLDEWRRTGLCRENFDARTGRGRGRWFQSWGPLFTLAALEEFADVTPWDGLRIGPGAPADGESAPASELRRLRIRGHDLTVRSGADRLTFQIDARPEVALCPVATLAGVEVDDRRLTARVVAGRPNRIRVGTGPWHPLNAPDGRISVAVEG